MTTSEPVPADGTITEQEAAVRRLFGYPAEGPIAVAGCYGNGRTYHRALWSLCDDEAARRVHDWHDLIARTWCLMLHASGVPVEGHGTIFRCPCVEATLRVFLIEQLSTATTTEGFTVPPEVEKIAAEFDYRVEDGCHRWERSIDEIAGYAFPALAVADASGLRIPRSGIDGVPEKLVAHARACRLPYPVNIVVRRAVEVGDVS